MIRAFVVVQALDLPDGAQVFFIRTRRFLALDPAEETRLVR
jgi:hypothetical protein